MTRSSTASSEHQAKVVYLFGAGATHAELANFALALAHDASFLEENSLLLSDVSRRVCRKALLDGHFSPRIRKLISSAGLSNVELLISLIEKNETKSDTIIQTLKRLIERDIKERLPSDRREQFYLHRALLEFHQLNAHVEKLLGIISLNYDRVLDDAYVAVLKARPNYGLSFHKSGMSALPPLLKLHGGFGITYRGSRLPIITPGINKNYLELPYNFIWGHALELLLDCDVLRIIGCSLSQNDLGLVDLLFKAHLKRKEPFTVQLVTYDPEVNPIKQSYGFFPRLETALEIESEGGHRVPLIADPRIRDPASGSNPFAIWLKAKIERVMNSELVSKSMYIKKVME